MALLLKQGDRYCCQQFISIKNSHKERRLYDPVFDDTISAYSKMATTDITNGIGRESGHYQGSSFKPG